MKSSRLCMEVGLGDRERKKNWEPPRDEAEAQQSRRNPSTRTVDSSNIPYQPRRAVRDAFASILPMLRWFDRVSWYLTCCSKSSSPSREEAAMKSASCQQPALRLPLLAYLPCELEEDTLNSQIAYGKKTSKSRKATVH
jgi:hypothetical protein